MPFAHAWLAVLALGLAIPEVVVAKQGHPGKSVRLAQATTRPPPGPSRGAPPAPQAAPAPPPSFAPPPPAAAPAPPAFAPPPPASAPAPRPGQAPAYAAGHPTVPAPPPGAPRPPGYYYGPGYYPYYPYYVSPWAYSAYLAAPWWWGWGWGYGWYPMYPAPPPPPPGEGPPPRRINAEFAFTGGPTDQRAWNDPSNRIGPGSSAGLSLRIEGQELGVHAGYDGFFLGRHADFGSSTALDYFTAHATWSILSGQSGRVRLEGGVSVLSWPALIAYSATGTATAYSAVTAVGPEAGVSGHLSLLGPLGIVGHARGTPWPRAATDIYLAAALRFGPLALTGGWRDLRADGGDTAPSLRFAGPQFGLAILF